MREQQLQLSRARSLGEIISDTFAFQTPNWRTFAAAVGPAVMISIIQQLVLFALLPGAPAADATTEELNTYFEDSLPAIGAFLAILPVAWVFQQLATAGVVFVMQAVGERRQVSAGDALDAAQDRAKDLLLASLRSIAIILLLLVSVIGIPWAIKRVVQWSFLTQAIMVEGAGHRDALQRSADLVRGSWWLTLGRLFCLWVMVLFAGYVLGGLITAIIPDVPGIVFAGCVGFLTSPFLIIATTLIYFDYRSRKTLSPAPVPPPEY
jgi:hypothetical protein